MMKIKFKTFNAESVGKAIREAAIQSAMAALEEKARGAAVSIVDPETGKPAVVFAERAPDYRVVIKTHGSPAFARLLERRLGIGMGEVETMSEASTKALKVYLAHASEDKLAARKIAKVLMVRGIDVWFDEWEISGGDSLRQKMEEGLNEASHFVVLLTPVSMKKPWVQLEIDAGLVGRVGGKNRFVGARLGVTPADLTIFLQTMHCPEIDPDSDASLVSFADMILGVSRKPELGERPTYVQSVPTGLAGWSEAAIAVAKVLITRSRNGESRDPILDFAELQVATGLSVDDVRIGAVDLRDAGLLWSSPVHREAVAPERGLFVEFDEYFMPFNPSEDAVALASLVLNRGEAHVSTPEMAQALGWTPRRMNSALCFLESSGSIDEKPSLADSPWRRIYVRANDRTLRFVRANA